MSGTQRIQDERARQIEEEGYSAEHDKREIAKAAAVILEEYSAEHGDELYLDWPWEDSSYPDGKDPERKLEIAGALIAAEIDRWEREEYEQ